MQYYISEEEAQYMDAHHGQFSKKLAEWAISGMEVKDEKSGEMKESPHHSIEEMESVLRSNGVKVKEAEIYTAWYLYNMTFADYQEALESDKSRAKFVAETLHDPDCKPEAVLACFRAKMDVKGVPIHWERMI